MFYSFVTPWTEVAFQGPLSMEFPRQEYWNRLPFPSLGDFPSQGIEPGFPALQADALPSEPPGRQRLELKEKMGENTQSYILQCSCQG